MQKETSLASQVLAALLFGYGSWWVYNHYGPALVYGAIQPLPSLALAILSLCGVKLAALSLKLLGQLLSLRDASRPKDLKGSASWMRSLRELGDDLDRKYWGPYWGAFRENGRLRELIIPYASNALTLGTAGSGKGIGAIQTSILAVRDSKTVNDFKGELACVLADALRKRGEIVRIVNLGDLWTDILGGSDRYNPLHIIADLFQLGGLLDVVSDAAGLSLQLYPEPEGQGGSDGDRYFRDGSRDLMSFAIQITVLIEGYGATLAKVRDLLTDKSALLRHAQWAAGQLKQEDGSIAALPVEMSSWTTDYDMQDVAFYQRELKGQAAAIADLIQSAEGRTFDSFITGARQALAAFGPASRMARVMSDSTFRFSEQKDCKPVTVFLVADASRIEAHAPILGLLNWCMLTELKRHKNKSVPVYLYAEECTNYKVDGLGSLLTWGRSYGLRLQLVVQSLSAFRRVYGQETLNTLLSETEIKQILPGTREPETLELVSKMLGEGPIIARGHRQSSKLIGTIEGHDLREDVRLLMTSDELRRTKKTILIVRRHKPLLVELPPIAAIAPWRKLIGINPFHGKPFRLPTVLRLKRRKTRRNA